MTSRERGQLIIKLIEFKSLKEIIKAKHKDIYLHHLLNEYELLLKPYFELLQI